MRGGRGGRREEGGGRREEGGGKERIYLHEITCVDTLLHAFCAACLFSVVVHLDCS